MSNEFNCSDTHLHSSMASSTPKAIAFIVATRRRCGRCFQRDQMVNYDMHHLSLILEKGKKHESSREPVHEYIRTRKYIWEHRQRAVLETAHTRKSKCTADFNFLKKCDLLGWSCCLKLSCGPCDHFIASPQHYSTFQKRRGEGSTCLTCEEVRSKFRKTSHASTLKQTHKSRREWDDRGFT